MPLTDRLPRSRRRRLAAAVAAVATGAGVLMAASLAGGTSASAAPPPHRPCDVLKKDGAPCAAAYSTIRAMFSAYNGPLYQIERAKGPGSKFKQVWTMGKGGYANGGTQRRFCAKTTCTITEIYDQTKNHNNLVVSPGGTQRFKTHDKPARAGALPALVDGHLVYGVLMPGGIPGSKDGKRAATPGTGYRLVANHGRGKGIATGGAPETIYEIADGQKTNSECCADFGNAEPGRTNGLGPGYMDTINLSSIGGHGLTGPWVQDDLERGVYRTGGTGTKDVIANTSPFATALVKTTETAFVTKTGDARKGALHTNFSGNLPGKDYNNMHKEGGIVLGVGGDNTDFGLSAFFEGAIIAHFTSNKADADLQRNIVATHYECTYPSGKPGHEHC